MDEAVGGGVSPILFLTNNRNTDGLFEWLCKKEPVVLRIEEPLTVSMVSELRPTFSISFNYRHIVSAEVIEALDGRIANVHCSILPYNKGASPNFFSFYENTPKGVTVHRMVAGLDAGDILLQQEVVMDKDETFASSYDRLIEAASRLVRENWDALKSGSCQSCPQEKGGTYHTKADFERIRARYPFTWDDRICDWKRLNGLA